MEDSYIKNIRKLIGNEYLMVNATAIVIANENNEILLEKRSDNQLWGLPGGLMELDDTIQSAALREVKEETNLDVFLDRFIGVFSNPFMRWKEADYAKVFTFAFTAKIVGGELKINDDESTELKYFGYEELPPLHSIDTVEIIEQYFNNKYFTIEGEKYDG